MNRIVNPTSIFAFTGRDFDKDVGLQATPNRRFDPTVGLQFNQLRHFDPAVGRWLDKEPIGYYQGDGNHGYAVNRPE
jgi:hypothetical protein